MALQAILVEDQLHSFKVCNITRLCTDVDERITKAEMNSLLECYHNTL